MEATEIITTPTTDQALATVQAYDKSPAAVYLAGLRSEASKRTMAQALAVIAGYLTGNPDILACKWFLLRFQHTQAIGAYLAGRYSAATANKMLSALRGVLKAAWNLELMSGEDYHRARAVEGVTGETIPAGRELSSGEIQALMQACENDPTPAGVRDAALIALLYACGLRRAELAALDLSNYDPESGALVVLGKRNKERTAYLVNGAYRAMADWLAVRGDDPGALFWPIGKGGKRANRHIATQAVYRILQKRAGQAGVKDFSPHDFRRTFVSDLLEAGADIVTVQKMAGHASVTTTARYDRRPEEAKRKAAGLLHVPYRGR